jgi:hypothetical protein
VWVFLRLALSESRLLCRVILVFEVSMSFYWYVGFASFWLGFVGFGVDF